MMQPTNETDAGNPGVANPYMTLRLTPRAEADIMVIRDWLVRQTHGGARITRTDCVFAGLRLAVDHIERCEKEEKT